MAEWEADKLWIRIKFCMVLKKKESLLSLGVHILFGAMLVFFEAEM
jgi:hypothetical protein